MKNLPKYKNAPPPPPDNKIRDEKILLELTIITGFSITDLIIKTKSLKTNLTAIKQFCLTTGRLPELIEDNFIYDHGFTNWYNAYRSPLFRSVIS